MLEINYSELFKNAHKEAREIVDEVGDYMIAFKIALTVQWKKAKKIELSESQIFKLEEDGWSRWTNYGYDRLYFNPVKNGTLKLTYHNSGNIDTAKWNGEDISNGRAYRIQGMKCFINVNDASVKVTNYRSSDEDEAEILAQAAKNSFEKAIA